MKKKYHSNASDAYMGINRYEGQKKVAALKRKLVPGRKYNFLRKISVREGGDGIPFTEKATLEALYPHFALFRMKNGLAVCYKYMELADMLLPSKGEETLAPMGETI